jgi:hypothetical protein
MSKSRKEQRDLAKRAKASENLMCPITHCPFCKEETEHTFLDMAEIEGKPRLLWLCSECHELYANVDGKIYIAGPIKE